MKIDSRIWVALGVAIVYFSTFLPSDQLRIAAITATGNQPYEGVWIFIPHLLFYSTLSAAVAAASWFALVRGGAMPAPSFAVSRPVIIWALIGGGLSVLATLAFLQVAGIGGPTWAGFDGWMIAGNVFSNFFEEFIYRGFLLAGLTVLVGFWPAAVISSIAFGFSHDQYPLSLQVLIMTVSVFWCWLVRHTRSIWAAWGAHMVLDIIVDTIWG